MRALLLTCIMLIQCTCVCLCASSSTAVYLHAKGRTPISWSYCMQQEYRGGTFHSFASASALVQCVPKIFTMDFMTHIALHEILCDSTSHGPVANKKWKEFYSSDSEFFATFMYNMNLILLHRCLSIAIIESYMIFLFFKCIMQNRITIIKPSLAWSTYHIFWHFLTFYCTVIIHTLWHEIYTIWFFLAFVIQSVHVNSQKWLS